ncbi:Putative inner membrane protein [Burkholderia sp. GAS332]|nr:Putative inner membrane protein [Burkholderia sp. GAS332]
MTTDRYRLSFTTGGLFLQEAPVIAERYLALRDWQQTRDQVRRDNLLQVRTAAAALRISKELVARLELLDLPELENLLKANLRDRGYPHCTSGREAYLKTSVKICSTLLIIWVPVMSFLFFVKAPTLTLLQKFYFLGVTSLFPALVLLFFAVSAYRKDKSFIALSERIFETFGWADPTSINLKKHRKARSERAIVPATDCGSFAAERLALCAVMCRIQHRRDDSDTTRFDRRSLSASRPLPRSASRHARRDRQDAPENPHVPRDFAKLAPVSRNL